ncbi:hypothetical protein I8J29_01720 [Paenibacillus sp. MWE-103]|uniref:Uncharacterized protein n=1 Tax=Paenibacillus artemisiicola TaxID=1172618 RepID=A0ABS3W3K9_9BACL|nr:hypothetical protein [Paenibacillus artemisiicola]MBO7742896.1 hypothetical protein [Paenibacillus artemisiicola]
MKDYYVTDKAHIYWDEAIETVVIRWHAFAKGDEFREPLDKMIELAVMKNAKKALFDSSHILVVAEDTKWLAEEWLPRLLNAGIHYTATVNPMRSSAVQADDDLVDPAPLLHHEFAGMCPAVEWLSGITA